ncbi:hypothetical protein JMJ56_28365 [Belnapia sp. T18]|uniref:Terminase large subunit-like endonuclease domain-containing protein n=1 Tax=Belnapia arida TaxID=2804533 RepID=A0ABS1UB29_9PROT|nr:terminase TerL endonuclease subunit [Belnapia arida]MBL6081903.1 hypothetical protein [Belnapia arida]
MARHSWRSGSGRRTSRWSSSVRPRRTFRRRSRLQHDGKPMLELCISSVVSKPDRRGNLYPTKARPEQKIDAAVALIMAVGGR